jgi:hypothetical protein
MKFVPRITKKLKAYLDETYGQSGVDGLYWLPVDEAMLSDVQKAHTDCAPFFMALELGPDRLAAELLVRTRNRVRCDCIHYADQRQRNWLIRPWMPFSRNWKLSPDRDGMPPVMLRSILHVLQTLIIVLWFILVTIRDCQHWSSSALFSAGMATVPI